MILYLSVSKISLPSVKLMTVLIAAGSVVTANNKFNLHHDTIEQQNMTVKLLILSNYDDN